MTTVRADATLPFGIPVTRLVNCSPWSSSQGYETIDGARTPDAVQWKGLQLFQSEETGGALVGVILSWYDRIGNAFSSSTIQAPNATTSYSPNENVIAIPNKSSKISIIPLFTDERLVYLCGFTVTYLAPNNQTYTKTAIVDSSSTASQGTPISLQRDEVLAGVQLAYLDLRLLRILDLGFLIARFPYGVQHLNVLGPATPVRTDVRETDRLLVQEIDNTNGAFDMVGTLDLSYAYTDSHIVSDSSTLGWEVGATATVALVVEENAIFESTNALMSLSVSYKYNQKKGSATSTRQSESKTYTSTALATVPAGKKVQVSLTGYSVKEPQTYSFQCKADAIYSWFLYLTGGIYTSDPIPTTLIFADIQRMVRFAIKQSDMT